MKQAGISKTLSLQRRSLLYIIKSAGYFRSLLGQHKIEKCLIILNCSDRKCWLFVYFVWEESVDYAYILCEKKMLNMCTFCVRRKCWICVHFVSKENVEYVYILYEKKMLTMCTFCVRKKCWICVHFEWEENVEYVYILYTNKMLNMSTFCVRIKCWRERIFFAAISHQYK